MRLKDGASRDLRYTESTTGLFDVDLGVELTEDEKVRSNTARMIVRLALRWGRNIKQDTPRIRWGDVLQLQSEQ